MSKADQIVKEIARIESDQARCEGMMAGDVRIAKGTTLAGLSEWHAKLQARIDELRDELDLERIAEDTCEGWAAMADQRRSEES